MQKSKNNFSKPAGICLFCPLFSCILVTFYSKLFCGLFTIESGETTIGQQVKRPNLTWEKGSYFAGYQSSSLKSHKRSITPHCHKNNPGTNNSQKVRLFAALPPLHWRIVVFVCKLQNLTKIASVWVCLLNIYIYSDYAFKSYVNFYLWHSMPANVHKVLKHVLQLLAMHFFP